MKTITPLLIIGIFCILFSGNNSHAADNEEINYLLTYLANSGCTFIRNGDEHEAQKASDHLKMKYNHAKRRIKTAEDFINNIAIGREGRNSTEKNTKRNPGSTTKESQAGGC